MNQIDQIDPTRLAHLARMTVLQLSHPRPADLPPSEPPPAACAMELVSWLAGEEHSDRPKCTCPVIAAFVRRFNDGIRSDAERTALLAPILPVLVGTRSDRATETRRAYLAADWSVRAATPAMLAAVGWDDLATRLRAIDPIDDRDSALRARQMTGSIVADDDCAADCAAASACAAYAAACACAACAAACACAADADAYAAACAAACADADADRSLRLRAARDEIRAGAIELIRRMCAIGA